MELKDVQFPKEIEKIHCYNDVPMFCTSGIHESIYLSLIESKKNKDSKIVVLGSGSGAFERRLLDNGFLNVTSVDFIPSNFLVKEIEVLEFDLNNDFSNIGKFDVVIAIEVIEHLENQFNFIRCVKKIMNKDAIFYLSTPNIENTFARMRYFLLGTLYWFGKGEMVGTGHINPIFRHILEFNLLQNNLKIEKYFGNINIWFKLFKNKNILKKYFFIFMSFVSLFMKNKNNYEINLFQIISID